ncbi:3-methyl-2-oxobutanoate hydroxymethyltransferase [Candidatus Latescibacterota bacterium]
MNYTSIHVDDFKRMKDERKKITALTAYSSLYAAFLDEAGIDLILVGDSLGNVFQGRETTIPVTLEEMIYHGEIVARSVSKSFVVVDMPFMSYQVNAEDALRNAGAVMKRTGCNAVKLEGGKTIKETIRKIVDTGIPVLAHIGLTPQSVNALGGYKVQGREDRKRIIEDAEAVEEVGAFAVVMEKIPRSLAGEITKKLSIPTIGIGAGSMCDGQILVTEDLLGLFREYKPKFVRKYADLADVALKGLGQYIEDVKNGVFPSDEESYE